MPYQTVNSAPLTPAHDKADSPSGMTRYRLALNSGVTHSTLKNIMHDTVSDNLLSTTILIANGFDMTVSEFLDSPLFHEENLMI